LDDSPYLAFIRKNKTMVATNHTTLSQHDQILTALNAAIKARLFIGESAPEAIKPEHEYKVFLMLCPHRTALKKLGVTLPTKGNYKDRLAVEAIGPDTWQVKKPTEGAQNTPLPVKGCGWSAPAISSILGTVSTGMRLRLGDYLAPLAVLRIATDG
jgi:hypothetical protein